MNWLGADIGGANLKLADGAGFAFSRSFPLWKHPKRLADELRELLAAAPSRGRLAVTMTGELADCFESKSAGVLHILHAVRQAAPGWQVWVYLTGGRVVPLETAEQEPLAAAASNWHALAAFAGRYHPRGSALLLDIGSTTCDLIPLRDGQVVARGHNDTDRMIENELVYTGVERSPVCAVARCLPYRGRSCPPAAELFATMRDVYLILGELAEQADCGDTADGRPATRAAACRRLARVVCADATQFTWEDAEVMAAAAAAEQAQLVSRAFERVVGRMTTAPEAILAAGHGEFLLRRVLDRVRFSGQIVWLGDVLGPAVARAATAHAVAVLAREQVPA